MRQSLLRQPSSLLHPSLPPPPPSPESTSILLNNFRRATVFESRNASRDAFQSAARCCLYRLWSVVRARIHSGDVTCAHRVLAHADVIAKRRDAHIRGVHAPLRNDTTGPLEAAILA